MNFAETSKQLRKARNLTQMELATELKVSKSCISMLEIGVNEPTANTLLRYAEYFQCSTDFLLGREDTLESVHYAASPLESLSADEQRLLLTYRKLNANNKNYLSAYADIRLQEQEI